MDIKKELETLEKNMTSNLSSAIDESVDTKLKDVQTELADMKQKLASTTSVYDEKKAQEDFVNIVKEVMLKGKNFIDVKQKFMNEATDGVGWEFVFDYFEKTVLNVMNEEPILREITLYNVLKSDKVKLPKYTNGIITTFEAEWTGWANSNWTTEYVNIDIERAVSRTDITEELLDDNLTIPDIFNLIVKDIAESQANFLANQVINGDGAGNNFLGLLNDPDVNEVVVDAGWTTVKDVLSDDIVTMISKAKRKFKKSWKRWQIFLMSEYVRWVLRNHAGKTTIGGVEYDFKDLMSDTPTLFGIRVITSDYAPIQDVAEDVAGANFLILGNFKYFTLAKRTWIEIETGYVWDNFNNSIKTIRAKQRVGWALTYAEAFTKWTLASA